MHWLIPVVFHSASCLYGWLGQSITPAALVLSIPLVAAQSVHLWGFYTIFAVFFLTSNGVAIASRYTGKPSSTRDGRRTASYLLANTFLAVALVPLHYYYMKKRTAVVKWFLIDQSPGGCLPTPSRTITEPWSYGFLDAVGNNLPWGIVVSFAVAMAATLSVSLGGSKGLSITNVFAGALGALLVAYTSAYVLPMCDGTFDAAEHVTATVDRSVAWKERTDMVWSDQARYQMLPAMVTVVGVLATVIQHVVYSALQGKGRAIQKSKQANGSVKESKQTIKDDELAETNGARDLASLFMNFLVTGGVILGLAAWSYLGATPRSLDDPEVPGSNLLLEQMVPS